MRLLKLSKCLPAFSLCVLLVGLSSPAAFGTDVFSPVFDLSHSSAQADNLMLAQNEELNTDDETPRSGSLILPATADEEKSEKKCMTVCQRWGQECMIDTTRGVRKCRRACKEFGQECF